MFSVVIADYTAIADYTIVIRGRTGTILSEFALTIAASPSLNLDSAVDCYAQRYTGPLKRSRARPIRRSTASGARVAARLTAIRS